MFRVIVGVVYLTEAAPKNNNILLFVWELIHSANNIPSSAVESSRVLTQFIEQLTYVEPHPLHLLRGPNREGSVYYCFRL